MERLESTPESASMCLEGSPPEDPERIFQSVLNAFKAVAGGNVVPPGYEEMEVLKAVGRAIREMG